MDDFLPWIAIIKCTVPPALAPVAYAHNELDCRAMLQRYIEAHGLHQYERALVVGVHSVYQHEGVSGMIVDQNGDTLDPADQPASECDPQNHEHAGPWTRVPGSDALDRCENCGTVIGK